MKQFKRYFLAIGTLMLAMVAVAQESSTTSIVRRNANDRNRKTTEAGITDRMQSRYEESQVSDADMVWMRVIYRQLDLTKDANTPLYFPVDVTEGSENLFRIMMRLLASNKIPAYEYLDGREVFTDQYRIKVKDMLDRFHIYYTEAKGSKEKDPRFDIDESDVPSAEVLSYYVIEQWEFDRVDNRMRTKVTAICPVLHREGDFGAEAVRYPMFWIKFDDLRPYLSTQNIFIDDDNNLATSTYDDYFTLNYYDGDIYKTRNLRNRSMQQLYPDPDDLKRAQDSIQNRLVTFENKLWVPSLEELASRREAKEKLEAAAAGQDTTVVESSSEKKLGSRSSRSKRGSTKASRPAKVKKAKASKPKAASSATRSVRNRKR